MEQLVDILVWALVLLMISNIVFKLLTYKVEKEIREFTEKIISDLDSGKLIPLVVETHGDVFLCYNKIDMAFVCQGSSLKELAVNFTLRYPNSTATIFGGEPDAVKILKQQLKELDENISSIRSTS